MCKCYRRWLVGCTVLLAAGLAGPLQAASVSASVSDADLRAVLLQLADTAGIDVLLSNKGAPVYPI